MAFQRPVVNKHVMVMCDNKTAVAYINKEEGTRLKRLFAIEKSILLWCCTTGTTIICWHIAGQLNVKVDLLSRNSQVIRTE